MYTNKAGDKVSLKSAYMIVSFFDINNVFFTLWDYPMSYLEFFGTIANILTVWLTTRKSVWNWPMGIVATVLFSVLFYQIRLYSDLLEQVYYLATGFWGWWAWTRVTSRNDEKEKTGDIEVLSRSGWLWVLVSLGVGTVLLGWFMARIHLFFPGIFPDPASFPYLDAFTTVASFVAQVLLILKRLESWYLWIVVDVIGVWLYSVKDVKFVALLFALFLGLAIKGYLSWRREVRVL